MTPYSDSLCHRTSHPSLSGAFRTLHSLPLLCPPPALLPLPMYCQKNHTFFLPSFFILCKYDQHKVSTSLLKVSSASFLDTETTPLALLRSSPHYHCLCDENILKFVFTVWGCHTRLQHCLAKSTSIPSATFPPLLLPPLTPLNSTHVDICTQSTHFASFCFVFNPLSPLVLTIYSWV